jgi:hypothetical protein
VDNCYKHVPESSNHSHESESPIVEVPDAHHVGIVGVQAHVGEGVQPSHQSVPLMAVQLGERVLRVLAGLHRWKRRGLLGGRRTGTRGPLDHMDSVRGLNLIHRKRILVLKFFFR